jgi:hypothetical protein
MKKYLLLILVFFALTNSISAQIDAVYKIKIISVRENYHKNSFDSLKKIGVLMFEPSDDNFTRVYLGTYLGKATADLVLKDVQQKGFKTAYVVKDENSFESTDGDTLTHTLQFSAVKELDMQQISEHTKMDKELRDKLLIWFYKGKYRLSMGLMPDGQSDRFTRYKKVLDSMDFKESFLQKCNATNRKKNANNPPKKSK